jgi:nitrogen-specific signal transduction histidine kinase
VPAENSNLAPPATFDGSGILDALSTGFLVLDAGLRRIYANVGAQDLLALSLRQSQGHPVGELFADAQGLIELLQRSLGKLETCADHEFILTPISFVSEQPAEPALDITITPMEGATGERQLLIELVDARARQRIARAELLTRADGSRLMVRQLAHEIRATARRPARAPSPWSASCPGSAQGIHHRHHQRGGRLRDLVDTMLGPTGPRQPLNVHELCEHVYQLLRSGRRAACTSSATTIRAFPREGSIAMNSSRPC